MKKEISEAIDIAIKTVERDIEFLEKHRKVESVHLSKNEKEKSRARANKRKDEEKKKKIKARREKVAKLYQEGKRNSRRITSSRKYSKGRYTKIIKSRIIGNLEKLISGKSKQEANIPIGNVEIYSGEER